MDVELRQVALKLSDDGRWKLDIDELFAACDELTRAIFAYCPATRQGGNAARRAACGARRMPQTWHLAGQRRGLYPSGVRNRSQLGRALTLDIVEPEDRVIVINSFSKSWSMTGWRLGWITHLDDAGEGFEKLVEYNIANPTTFSSTRALRQFGKGSPSSRKP